MLRALYNVIVRISMYLEINSKIDKVIGVLKEAELYQNTNKMQRKDSTEALEEYSSRIRWKNQNAKILDVGCGDGGVTVQILKPYLPRNFENLVGCDISKEMITHANLYNDDRTEFTVIDIAGDTVPQLLGQFDHIFSFYALHWIQEQEKALSNIYSMLVPGGDCLLLFICHQPVYNTYRTMASSSTWSQYMFDVENFITPYHDSQNPVEEHTNLMVKYGFKNVEVQRKDKVFTYTDFETMKKALRSVNPFIHRLPPLLKERFMEDLMEVVMRTDGISKISNNNGESEKIQNSYTLLLVYAST